MRGNEMALYYRGVGALSLAHERRRLFEPQSGITGIEFEMNQKPPMSDRALENLWEKHHKQHRTPENFDPWTGLGAGPQGRVEQASPGLRSLGGAVGGFGSGDERRLSR